MIPTHPCPREIRVHCSAAAMSHCQAPSPTQYGVPTSKRPARFALAAFTSLRSYTPLAHTFINLLLTTSTAAPRLIPSRVLLMSLEPGTLTLTLEYGQKLRDVQWFGRQDPYCVLTVGDRTVKSRVHTDGGRNPVWNQTFQFSVINENNVDLQVKDEEVFEDTYIGSGTISLARARAHGSDRQQVPIITRRGKTQGFVQVALTFVKHISPSAAAYAMAAVNPLPPQPLPPSTSFPAWGPSPSYGYSMPTPPPYATPSHSFPHPYAGYAPPPLAPAPMQLPSQPPPPFPVAPPPMPLSAPAPPPAPPATVAQILWPGYFQSQYAH